MVPDDLLRVETIQQQRRMAAELSILSKAQSEALQKAPYIRMSKAERGAYDRRRERIDELCESLTKFRPKERIVA